jgi:hypothetical protein
VDSSEIAYRAAEIMSERGHCKNALTDEEGRVCLIGALEAVTHGNSGDYFRVLETANAILRERGEDSFLSPGNPFLSIFYNNHPDTTGEDVILLLKAAGKELETPCTQ